MKRTGISSTVFASLGLSLFLLSSGCTLYNPTKTSMGEQAIPVSKTANQYAVHMKDWRGDAKVYRGVFEESITVDDALVAAGAKRKYRSMEIDVMRRDPKSGRMIKLAADYDTRKKRIKFEQDYAVHPGDQIVVRPKSGGAMEKLVHSVFGR